MSKPPIELSFERFRLACKMSLRSELLDSPDAAALEDLLSRHPATHSLVRRLVALVGDETVQEQATWMLKRLAENHVNLKTSHLIALFGSASELSTWLSKLHVCQMLQHVVIPEESTGSVAWMLERNLMDENRFLRAWSYNGFYELAKQHPKYIDYAMEQLERAETEQAASVKARIRNIRKSMSKLPRKD